MSPEEAMSFIERHGIVLASAKGPVPSLAATLVGEPIKGSWWVHPKGQLIFSTFEAITDAPDILSCRLIDGKVFCDSMGCGRDRLVVMHPAYGFT